MNFNQIKVNSTTELMINKSKFIAKSFVVLSTVDVNNIIDNLKSEYRDATHICYAYKLHTSEERCFDDGEPQGTAGMPILNVIKKYDITNVLVVVIRYFGGIKLGAGGLLRAYSNSANSVLDISQTKICYECKKISFFVEMSQTKIVNSLQNIIEIKKVELKYADKIEVSVFVEDRDIEKVKSILNNLFSSKINFLEFVEKYFL